MAVAEDRQKARQRRHLRTRKKIIGTAERPRLSVFRSLLHTYAQVIDDIGGRTLVSVATTERALKEKLDSRATCQAAKTLGTILAQRALEKGIQKVVFDRGGYHYHGRVKALADAAREAGLDL